MGRASPEASGWTAVTDTYDEAHRLAEYGVRFPLTRDNIAVEHTL